MPTCSRSCDSAGPQSIVCVSLLTANADARKIEMIVVNVVFITNFSSSEHIVLDKICFLPFQTNHLDRTPCVSAVATNAFLQWILNSADLQSIVCVSLLTANADARNIEMIVVNDVYFKWFKSRCCFSPQTLVVSISNHNHLDLHRT